MNNAVNHIAINTAEATLFKFLFQHVNHGSVELSVKQQHAIAFSLSPLNVAILLIAVSGIQVNQVAILVSLVVLNEVAIFVKGKVLALNILEQSIRFSLVIKVVFREHTIVDEQLQVIPLLLKILTVRLKNRL